MGGSDVANSRVPLSRRTEWPGDFGNWDRWPNDRGTLNLITPAKVVQAAGSVRDGEVFACAPPLRSEEYPEELQRLYNLDPFGYKYEMYPMAEGAQSANDKITMALHRRENTHIDALSHVAHQGVGFGGVPFSEIVDAGGAKRFDVTQLLGIVTRAIVVDVPRIRDVPYLEPGDWVTEADLAAGASDLEPGDALLVRTGNPLAPPVPLDASDPHGRSAGMGLDAMRFVADRDVAVLATDSTGDTYPLPLPDQPTIHMICEVYLGLPLLHGVYLEDLATACAERGRTTCLLSVAALHIVGGTGSPVTPLCVL
jgi:kynurenine formamidase